MSRENMNDIQAIQNATERILDHDTSVWVSIDLESDLINEMAANEWTTSTSSGYFFVPSEAKDDMADNGFSIDVPDTVALEILGVILRHKLQLIKNEGNNI